LSYLHDDSLIRIRLQSDAHFIFSCQRANILNFSTFEEKLQIKTTVLDLVKSEWHCCTPLGWQKVRANTSSHISAHTDDVCYAMQVKFTASLCFQRVILCHACQETFIFTTFYHVKCSKQSNTWHYSFCIFRLLIYL
jgi:hypothetical protein